MGLIASITAESIEKRIQEVIEEELVKGTSPDYIDGLIRAAKIAHMYAD